MQACLAMVMAVLALAVPAAHARELLRGRRDWGDTGDPNGNDVLARAKVFMSEGGKTARALTPEAAESVSDSQFSGIWRAEVGTTRAAYATVESDPVTLNPDRKKLTINPRARSAIDSAVGPRPDVESGDPMLPVVAMGNAAVSQTYQGALAGSATDSVTINGRNYASEVGRGKATTHANSMLTPYIQPAPRAGRGGSYGATATTAGSAALAGAADGTVVVAQAHQVAAVAQAAASGVDQWQQPAGSSNSRNVGKNAS